MSGNTFSPRLYRHTEGGGGQALVERVGVRPGQVDSDMW